jgi:hypothetical protein
VGQQWLHDIPLVTSPQELDFGDYTPINLAAGFIGGALILDDYGTSGTGNYHGLFCRSRVGNLHRLV